MVEMGGVRALESEGGWRARYGNVRVGYANTLSCFSFSR